MSQQHRKQENLWLHPHTIAWYDIVLIGQFVCTILCWIVPCTFITNLISLEKLPWIRILTGIIWSYAFLIEGVRWIKQYIVSDPRDIANDIVSLLFNIY